MSTLNEMVESEFVAADLPERLESPFATDRP
jgi:hypothetical protein